LAELRDPERKISLSSGTRRRSGLAELDKTGEARVGQGGTRGHKKGTFEREKAEFETPQGKERRGGLIKQAFRSALGGEKKEKEEGCAREKNLPVTNPSRERHRREG